MADYPERDGHFAHKAIRVMTRSCAAQEIGSDAFALVVVVVHTEDARRYAGPVTFWNDQLQSILGFTWGKLDRARKRAIKAGWLHYEPGGKARVGRYWVTIPPTVAGLAPTPVDEDHPACVFTGGEESSRDHHVSLSTCGETNVIEPVSPPFLSPPVERDPGDIRGTSGGETGDIRGRSADLSSLTYTKKTHTKKEPPLPPFDEIQFPAGFDTPAVRWAITEWLDYKRLRGERYKQPARQISKLLTEDWCRSPEAFVKAVNHSIARNYAGCFPAGTGGRHGINRASSCSAAARVR